MSRPTTRVTIGAVAALAAYALVCWGPRGPVRHEAALLLVAVAVTGAASWWAVRGGRAPARPVLLVVAAAAAVQLPGLTVDPVHSTDAYRYVWDGRVQLAGVDPYRYAPLDDRLAHLRDPVLFPGLGPRDQSGFLTRPLPADPAELKQLAADDPRTRINRPRVPTIYPPAAQAWFTAVAAVTPWHAGTRGLQLAGAVVAVGVAAMLAAALRRRGRTPLGALWFAWSPLAVIEGGNNAHVDVVAAALVLGAVLLADAALPADALRLPPRPARPPRPAAVGVLVGLAAAVKLWPLALLPAVMTWRRGGWARQAWAPLAALAVLVAGYLPHLAAVGLLVVGYLPGYAVEESRWRALALQWLPDLLVAPAAAAALAAALAWAARQGGRRPVPEVAVVVVGVVLLTVPSAYVWYAVPLAAVAVLAGRLEWLAVGLVGYLDPFAGSVPGGHVALHLTAALVVVGISVGRRRRAVTSLGTGRRPPRPAETP